MAKKPEISLRVRAMRFLARREYSRTELQCKLSPYILLGEDIDALLADLVASGWLSDERASTLLVHSKRKRFGTQRIVHELRQKGIPENLIKETLPELRESELDTARAVWQKKFGILPSDEKEKGKQIRFLQSRGFSIDVIYKMLGSD